MAPLDEITPLEWEKPIPETVTKEAEALAEVLTDPEKLDVDSILQDLGIEDEKSPEAEYLKEAVAWLNNKMDVLNEEMNQALPNLPDYFAQKCTNQMEMQWDRKLHHLTVLSQGQVVMKFEIWREETSVWWLGIYMKDLFTEQQESTDNDIDPNQFLQFSTTREGDGDWWLFSFSELYTDVFWKPSERWNETYVWMYMWSNEVVIENTTPTQKSVLPPQHAMKLVWRWFSASSVTINTIFKEPQPATVEIRYPDGQVINAEFQNWKYVDENWVRPKIWNGSVIKNTIPWPTNNVQFSVENKTSPKRSVLPPQHAVHLAWLWFSASSVTINTIFAEPQPNTVEIKYPNGRIVEATLQQSWYKDEQWNRPKIWNNCIIRNTMPSFEDMQLAVEQHILQPWMKYTQNQLFTNLSNESPAFVQAVQEYFSLLEKGEVSVEGNTTWLHTYVDMTKEGYVLRYELKNKFGKRPYHTWLTMPLATCFINGNFNSTPFQELLKQEVSAIVRKNFLSSEKIRNTTQLTQSDFTEVKQQTTIKARWIANYIEKDAAWKVTMTNCSTAAQDSARRNFSIILPGGNAKDAFTEKAIERQNQTSWNYLDTLTAWETLTDLWVNGMYALLSKYLHEWCTVVDIWYNSTATANGKRYWHRNIAYYCYDTKEWYILDPVSSFWNAATSRPIPLRSALSSKYSPKYMRYYKPEVGVYEKDA